MNRSSTFGSRAARRRSERELAAERLRAVTNLGRRGWVPDDPSDDGEAADPVPHLGGRPSRRREPEEPPTSEPPRGRDTLSARLLDRLLLHTLPGTVRAARWSVPPAAVVALLVLAGLLALVVAVRTASAAPGVPVPARPSEVASSSGGAGASSEPAPATAGDRQGGEASVGLASASQPVSGPSVAARPARAGDVVVHVVGQVAAPGLVRVPAGSRVDDAVRAAGGATAEADLARVNLARPVVDGEQLFVPRPGEEVPASSGTVSEPEAPGAGPGASPDGSGTAPQGGLVDLNTATVEQLDTLPGIGPVLAGRVVDWRTQNGRFTSVDELAEVSGIGSKVLDGLRPLVTVAGA